jgi:hypothetical protein
VQAGLAFQFLEAQLDLEDLVAAASSKRGCWLGRPDEEAAEEVAQ